MKREDFVRNLRGVDSGENLDQEMLCGIYDRIKANEFRPGTDHVTQVRELFTRNYNKPISDNLLFISKGLKG